MKLVAKLTVVISLIGGAIILVSGFSTFIFARQYVENILGKNQIQLANFVMNEIDHNIYERFIDIQAFADDMEIENYLADRKFSEQAILDLIKDWYLLSGFWDDLALYDYKGNKVLSVKQDNNVSLQEYEAVQVALSGESYYSDLVVIENERPTIFFSVPVRDESTEGQPIVGAVVGQFSWPAIIEVLKEIDTANLYLLNSDYKIIASNQDNYFTRSTELITLSKPFLSKGVESSIGSSVDGSFTALNIQVEQMGFLSYAGNGWSLLLEIPIDTVFAPATNFSWLLSGIFTFSIILAILIILWFLHKIFILPIKNLTYTAIAISKGELKEKAKVDSEDEVGELAMAFNIMLEKLSKSRENIEQKIQERTSDLQKLAQAMTGRELKMLELKERIKELEQKKNNKKK